MNFAKQSINLHRKLKGKIEIKSKVKVDNLNALSLAYTPGVAAPCSLIAKKPNESFSLTARGNLVAVITDGSAVLGLGNIGPTAGIPVMEGKCVLFKAFANINAFPLCLNTQKTDEIINIIKALEPSFAAINLEDISAPRCFVIEEQLKQELSIPIMHDDQHGTAIVVAAALINAIKVAHKQKGKLKIVISGAGAAGIAIAKLLLLMEFGNVVMVDKVGILNKNNSTLPSHHLNIAQLTNKNNESGTLKDAMKNADVFIGVSIGNIVSLKMAKSMNKNAIVFAMANPLPEILPEIATAAGVKVMGTGRSDFPNQINNALVFPGMFRGTLDAKAKQITAAMKIAAVNALASLVTKNKLKPNYVIPSILDKRVVPAIAKAVAKASRR
ncbi:MAG: NADP-dependent malic enzyme [Mycoplasmataceae bacterium]|jgi:malate dehydrogenase (oxaloacetate-decarboxylating)|nr:NADP-dependent malic enzyme [Mycoplasmataceae bacterium]